MKPVSISEQMMFNTVRLECLDGSSGTGFFFNFEFEDNRIVPVLITNKHGCGLQPTGAFGKCKEMQKMEGEESHKATQ